MNPPDPAPRPAAPVPVKLVAFWTGFLGGLVLAILLLPPIIRALR